jgi:hypothetical protein
MKRLRNIFLAGALAAGGLLAISPPAIGQAYPLLEQLNRESQSLYKEVQGGIVRVQLPTPKWIRDAAAGDDPLRKWDSQAIDPNVKKQLDNARARVAATGKPAKIDATVIEPAPASGSPATRPAATQGAVGGWRAAQKPGEIVLEPGRNGAALVIQAASDEGGPENAGAPAAPMRLGTRPASNFAPNNIGLVLDDDGHVLIPLYLEQQTLAGQAVQMMVGNESTTATFVASDEKTNVTILKTAKPIGKPVRFAPARPATGSLVMLLNPNNASGRLIMWTGGERDYGVVVAMDGSVAGFVRFGQFLGGVASEQVIRQLIENKKVERAVLGVRLTEVRNDSPIRQLDLTLGDRPALSVDEVAADSLAEKAGIRAGDLLLEIDSQPVGDLTTFSALSARGGNAKVLILRQGEEKTIDVNLQPPPRP